MMAAVTYFIAGKSNCPLFAKAQRIGEIISRNLPAIAVRINTQHPHEWPAYLDSLCSRLQFSHASSPVVYNHLGTLIGGSEAFQSLVSKMYGNIVDIPSAVLNDIANENHEQAMKNMQIKETVAANKLYEEQWEMRNDRLRVLSGQVEGHLNAYTENVSQLYQTCQTIKATLTVAPEKNTMIGEPVMLQKHLATLTDMIPKFESVTAEKEAITGVANLFGAIPSVTSNSRFSRTPDTIWQLMFVDHQKIMNEFIGALNKMHETNQIVQDELAKLVAAPPPTQSPSPPPTINSSAFSVPVDKLPKSVSFAGIDTQYPPKDTKAYASLPSTPKKNEPEEVKDATQNETPSIPQVDVGPLESAIKAMRSAVDEGLGILKSAKKQLRINLNNTNKQVSTLQKVLDQDEYRYFKLRERREVGKNVHLFRFDLPAANDVLGCPIGKHVKVKVGDTERAYSPITTDYDAGFFDLAIKVTRDTPIMDLFASLSPGDWIPVRGPSGAHVFKESEKISGIAMFAHGVGLTPMLQVIRHHLSKDDNMPLWLLYFNSEERMLMKEELERLSTAHTRFNLRYVTAKPGNHWEYLQAQDLIQSLPFRPSGFDFSTDSTPLKLLICGTRNFTKKTKLLLEEMGYREEYIHTFE